MKLYYPEKWAGYGSEVRQLLELLCGGVFGGVCFVAMWTLYRHLAIRRGHQHWVKVAFDSVLVRIIVCGAAGQAGRSSLHHELHE